MIASEQWRPMVKQRSPNKPRDTECHRRVAMPSGFDPYQAWLNVREVRRPLNAYELLGIKVFEQDEETIRTAAGQKRAALMAHRNAAPAEVWNQVYAELREATETLLNADRKEAYDAALKANSGGYGLPGGGNLAGNGFGGSMLRCGACGASNYATRKFCTQCGASLWEACVVCGTVSPASEKFCGACGCNLAEALREYLGQYQADLQNAQALQAEGRFDEALTIFQKIAKAEHPRLKHLAARADQAIKEIAVQRERATVEAEKAFVEAEQALARQDYRRAVELLESIPPGLRSPAAQAMLADATARAEELERLEQQLATLGEGGSVRDVVATIDRLLALKHDHPQAVQAAERLQGPLVEAARQKLSAHDYQTALKLLQRIPEAVRSEAARELYQQVEQLAWLAAQLRRSPVIHPVLPAIAKRIHELAPGDPLPARALAAIKERLQRHREQRLSTAPRWAPPPKEPYLGFSVDWLTGFRKIDQPDEATAQLLDAHPGCFFVAFGLALQGLGHGAIRTNLLPAETRRFFDFIRRPIRLGRARTAWGIDIGASSLKAVRLSWDSRQEIAHLEAVEHMPHRKPLDQAVNSIEEEALAEETVRAFIERHKLKGDCLVLGIPGRVVLYRRLSVPMADKKKQHQVVEFEARRNLPFHLVEVAWDYQLLGDADNQQELAAVSATVGRQDGSTGSRGKQRRTTQPLRRQDMLLVAAKKVALMRRLERLRHLGLQPDFLQADCLALYNFWMYEYGNDPLAAASFAGQEDEQSDHRPRSAGNSKSLVALLDVGEDATNIVICAPGLVWFRTLGFGWFCFRRAVVQEFKLTTAQADQWLRDPLKCPSPASMYRAIEPQFDSLAQEVQQTIEIFQKDAPDYSLQRMFLCGGGARLHGLLRYLYMGS